MTVSSKRYKPPPPQLTYPPQWCAWQKQNKQKNVINSNGDCLFCSRPALQSHSVSGSPHVFDCYDVETAPEDKGSAKAPLARMWVGQEPARGQLSLQTLLDEAGWRGTLYICTARPLTRSIACRHLPPKEWCRKTVLGVCARPLTRLLTKKERSKGREKNVCQKNNSETIDGRAIEGYQWQEASQCRPHPTPPKNHPAQKLNKGNKTTAATTCFFSSRFFFFFF